MLGALGLREATLPDRRAAAADAESQLARRARRGDALLVLDNCEHIVVPAARARRPAARRPAPGCGSSRRAASRSGSAARRSPRSGRSTRTPPCALFADRAASASPDFALDETTAPIVADVCRRIDGLPLAIELAAARLRSMPLEQLADRLHDRFRLLTGGSRAAAGRQRTLRAVVDWSWDLLSEPERRLARRLSVFPAGATLDAVEAVCAGDGVDADDVFDLLCALVDRSLLRRRGRGRRRAGGCSRRSASTPRRRPSARASCRAARGARAALRRARPSRPTAHLRGPTSCRGSPGCAPTATTCSPALRFLGETGEGALALRTAHARCCGSGRSTDGREEAVDVAALRAGGRRRDGPAATVLLAEAIVAWTDPDAQPVEPHEARRAGALTLLDGADLDRPAAARDRRAGRRVLRRRPGARRRDARRPRRRTRTRGCGRWRRSPARRSRRTTGDLEEMREHLDVALERFRAPATAGALAASRSPSSPRCTCSTATSTRRGGRARRRRERAPGRARLRLAERHDAHAPRRAA